MERILGQEEEWSVGTQQCLVRQPLIIEPPMDETLTF